MTHCHSRRHFVTQLTRCQLVQSPGRGYDDRVWRNTHGQARGPSYGHRIHTMGCCHHLHSARHRTLDDVMRGREVRELRRERAEEIARARATRTAEQQLASLDDRLGEGEGASKERARLQREIDDRAPKPKSKPSPSTSPSPSTTSRRDRASKAKDRRSEQRASARRGARAARKG